MTEVVRDVFALELIKRGLLSDSNADGTATKDEAIDPVYAAAVMAAAGQQTAAGAPTVTVAGTPGVGNVLTAVLSSGWSATTYQWYRDGVPISGATSETYIQTESDLGSNLDVTVIAQAVSSSGTVAVPGDGGTTVVTVGGIDVGSAGASGSVYEGFTLAFGDDFSSVPSTWSGQNLSGKYAPFRPQSGLRRSQVSGLDRMIYIDPGYKGARHQSQTALGVGAMTSDGDMLTMTASAVPAELSNYVPTNWPGAEANGGKPYLISAAIRTWPSFMFSAEGNFIFEGKVQFPLGAAAGYWPSLWCSGLTWPDTGEIDLLEGSKDGAGNVSNSMNVHGSDTDGGPNVPVHIGDVAMPIGRDVHLLVKKTGATLQFFDDAAAEGTLALRATYTNSKVSRIRKAHDLRLELAVSNQWDSSTYNGAQWPKTFQCDWIRAWVPTGSPANMPMNQLGSTQVAPGGSWAYTIPDNITLFGGAVDTLYAVAVFDDTDCPGWATAANNLPGGMTVDLVGRSISGTIPTTEGGRVGVLFMGSFSSGGCARRAVKFWDVAPAVQNLFVNFSVSTGAVVSQQIPYDAFHSGNLGPHTYNVTKVSGGAWLTIGGNGTGVVSLSGTSPGSDEVVTLQIRCTNAIGQVTTVTRTISVVGAYVFSPGTWADAIEWFDPSDNTTVFSDAAATVQATTGAEVRALKGKKQNIVLSNASADSSTPSYISDAPSGQKALQFTRTTPDHLESASSTLLANVNGSDNAFAVIAAVKWEGGSTTAMFNFCRDDANTVVEFIRMQVSSSGLAGMQRVVDATALQAFATTNAISPNSWVVMSWIFSGTTVTIRVNGTVVVNETALDAPTMTLHKFSLGALYKNDSNIFESASAFGGAIGEHMICNGLSVADPKISEAENYLLAKWHN